MDSQESFFGCSAEDSGEAGREDPATEDKFTRLLAWKNRLQAREKELFGKCVSAQMEGDSEKATMYANQCAEVRKVIRLVAGTAETLSKLSTPAG